MHACMLRMAMDEDEDEDEEKKLVTTTVHAPHITYMLAAPLHDRNLTASQDPKISRSRKIINKQVLVQKPSNSNFFLEF